MSREMKPKVVTISEFRKIEKPIRKSVAIFYTQQQLERAIKGVKPATHVPATGPGLEIIPIPGGPGYLGFPVCWPGEVPVIGPDGQIRCVPSAFEDTSEPREPVEEAERVCGLTVAIGGGLRCTGRCSGGGACIRIFTLEGGRFGFRCRCLVRMRVPVRRTAVARGATRAS